MIDAVIDGRNDRAIGSDLIIARVSKARILLAQARNATDAKKVSDMAHAAEVYARRQKLGQESIQFAHTIVIDAQRLLGEFLEKQELNPGSRGRFAGPSGRAVPAPKLIESGISWKESSRAQLVAKVARAKPQLFEDLRNGKAGFSDLIREEKRDRHFEAVAQAKRNAAQPFAGPFDLIVADPPWRYEHCEANNREIENHYGTASIPEIFQHFGQANPKTKDDQILFLWATAPKLEEALQVMSAWGFCYRSCAVWDKEAIGMGYWWRIQHELLLVGVRGEPAVTPECERVSSIFRERRTQHSLKPESVMCWIERAFPLAAKLEMYQRKPRKGWAGWGNEA